jgi:hypothetical protein
MAAPTLDHSRFAVRDAPMVPRGSTVAEEVAPPVDGLGRERAVESGAFRARDVGVLIGAIADAGRLEYHDHVFRPSA